MSPLELMCIILSVAATTRASVDPHLDIHPLGTLPQFFAPSLFHAHGHFLPPVVHASSSIIPAAIPHIVQAPHLLPSPILPAPILPAPVVPAPAAPPVLPAAVPLPLAKVLPPFLEPFPFASAYRAIPGPVTKSHHLSVGFAHPVPVPHVHSAKLVLPAHSHGHAHSASFVAPHHHHHVIA